MSAGRSKHQKPGRIVSLSELAVVLGCTTPTVRAHIRAGMPVQQTGHPGTGYRLDTANCIRWLLQQARDSVSVGIADYDADRARKMAADADKSEMERDIMRGELVEVEVAIQIVADRLSSVRARLLSLPTKTAGRVSALRTREEAVTYMEQEIENILRELSGADSSS